MISPARARFLMPLAWCMVLAATPAPALAQAPPQAAPAQATPAPSPKADEDIVVTGSAVPPDEAVRQLTRAVAKRADGQVARFDDAVCPAVLGIADRYAEIVAKRIRAAATGADIVVADAGCRANIIVMIVANGQAILQGDNRTGQRLTRGLSLDDRRKLLADAGPVHAWTVTELRSRDGDRVRGGILNVNSASILNPPTRRDIVGAMIMLDEGALLGKSLGQIADYAAMRTLAQTRPAAGNVDRPTILTLFDPAESTPPPGLTSFDAGYLKALYEGPATRSFLTKIQSIARRINQSEARDAAH